MSRHKLPLGKALIEGIFDIGQMLGYHVEKEYPVDSSVYGEEPAVDIAWFSKKENTFPLFIFEVESKAGNAMTANPLKVYANENKKFEKPLFFFHLVAQGGINSRYPRDLESQYGKNNYRVYLIDSGSTTQFFCDVLAQHVRVRDEIDYIELYSLLQSAPWVDKVDFIGVLNHAANLELSKAKIISSFVHISRLNNDLLPTLITLLNAEASINFENITFDSYLGDHWFYPIICAMMIGISIDSKESERWSTILLAWQNQHVYMPMITPAFGLSRDYDEFILGLAPQLITICIVISGKKGSFIEDFVKILVEILNKVGVCWAGLNSAIYLLHISARLGMRSEFKIAKSYLISYGPISSDNIYFPPSAVPISDGEFKDYFQKTTAHKIPPFDDFIARNENLHLGKEPDLQELALRALDDHLYYFEWSEDLLDALWSKNVNKQRSNSN